MSYNRSWENGVVNSSQPYVHGTVDPWGQYFVVPTFETNPYSDVLGNYPQRPASETDARIYSRLALGLNSKQQTGDCCTPKQYSQGCTTYVGTKYMSCVPNGSKVTFTGEKTPICQIEKN